jgi:hypothetical protein
MSPLADYYTENQLGTELRCKIGSGSVRTLRTWRQRRIGPPWAKIGQSVVYPHDGFEK